MSGFRERSHSSNRQYRVLANGGYPAGLAEISATTATVATPSQMGTPSSAPFSDLQLVSLRQTPGSRLGQGIPEASMFQAQLPPFTLTAVASPRSLSSSKSRNLLSPEGVGTKHPYAVQVYSSPSRVVLRLIFGGFEPAFDSSLLRRSTAVELGLTIHPLPPCNQVLCQGPGGLVRPTEFVKVALRVCGSRIPGVEAALRVWDWEDAPEIYLSKRFTATPSALGPGLAWLFPDPAGEGL